VEDKEKPMSQETTPNAAFNQRINVIIAVVVAIIAVLGSFITKLESEASTASNKANMAEQQFYYQGIGKQISGKADINHAFGTVYQLWYQYEVQRLSAQKRGDTDATKTITELRDAVARTSSLFDPKYFNAATGKVNLILYEADVYRRQLYELEEKQLAADEVASAWDDKSSQYILQLTLLAVAGFLLGLALMTKARIPTLVFSISGISMVMIISIWAYQLSRVRVVERPANAITALAEGASLIDQRRWDDSLKLLNKAIHEAGADHPYARAYLLRAQVHSEMGNFAEAINDYQVAIDSGFEADPTVNASLVRAYYSIGDFDNAIQTGNTAIRNSPDNLVLLQQVNMAVLAKGDISTATEAAAMMMNKAAKKAKVLRDLGDDDAAAETWWLLNDAAYQYDRLAALLETRNVTSPVKENIDDPTTVAKKAHELASQLRAGAIALKYNAPPEQVSATASSAKIDIKTIVPSKTPDQKYVYKVDLEFAYSGMQAGQLLSIATYRNGIEEPSWSFGQKWVSQQASGTASYTLSPSYSSIYLVPPGFYIVYIYLNDKLLAQSEFTIENSDGVIDVTALDALAFDDMLDQFDFYTSDYIYGYFEGGNWDDYDWYYYSYDPFFFYDEENSYAYFLEGSYDFYADYCTDSNDLDCYTFDDQDGDGIPDEYDSCMLEPGPMDFYGCPVLAGDADGDGISDESDACPYAAGLEEDNGCLVEDLVLDFDGDGTPDSSDTCPDEPGSIEYAGCPVSTDDADGDGISDESDACPYAVGLEEDNGCPVEDLVLDFDGDGTPDSSDTCPDEPGSMENGGCPVSTGDVDGDGISDEFDNCPYASGLEENNGCPAEVSDSDGDGIPNSYDNCPEEPGPMENGGCPGNNSEPDSDGDGIPDSVDSCPGEPGPAGNDGCPIIDDPDSDGDGILDSADGCPGEPGPAGNDGCPIIDDPDSDGDGIPDSVDGCPGEPGPAGNDGCPIIDDPDSDGDGIPDSVDGCPNEAGPPENGGCP
jgi:tetratricopeptide (TPR) repeat protein